MSARDEAAGGVEPVSDIDLDALITTRECNPSLLGFRDAVLSCLRELKSRRSPSPRDQASSAMLGALEKVAAWDLPPSGMFWDKERTEPMSFAMAFGSMGERHHFQKIAREAVQLARSAGIEPGEGG